MISVTCPLCDADREDESATIFRDSLWAAGVVPGYEVPGWVVLRVRRHAERITGLSDEELAGLSYRARDLVAAITEVIGAPVTYLMVFGENHPHFHVLITPRAADAPADRRSGDILKSRTELADPSAARGLVPALRAAYLAQTGGVSASADQAATLRH